MTSLLYFVCVVVTAVETTSMTAATSRLAAGEQKNVLLLVSDNQNWNDLGCYGNRVIQTPNLDQLASHGTRFEYGFATTASCGPSRAVLYTGLLTHSNGQYGHGHGLHTFRLMPNVRTIFQILSEHGYRTALLGKQHTTPDESYPFTFNPSLNSRDVMGIAKAGDEFIRQSDTQPFFLVIGYGDPHPTSRERPGWGIRRDYPDITPVTYDPKRVDVPSYLPDRPEVREGLAGYYQQISRMDAGVGAILKSLQDSGKADETLVLFTSDHGSSEPGAMSNHYEPGIRVPFIVRRPGSTRSGFTNNALVTLADIVPTVLEWTGVEGPEYELDGKSVLSILDDDAPPGWDEVVLSHVCHEVTMYYPMRTIRNRRYKLIWNLNWKSEYPLPIDTLNRATWQETIRRKEPNIGPRSVKNYLYRDEIELYDLQEDPDEIHNLADRPDHAQLRRQLSQRLLQRLEASHDPWLERHRLPIPGDPSGSSSRQTEFDNEQ